MGLIVMAAALTGCGKTQERTEDFHTELFGEHVYIFSPEDDPAQVQAVLDGIYRTQETGQFGQERYALYFLPGTYDESLQVQVGFYTQVAGLGKLPTDTKIPKLQSLARWLGNDPGNHNACCNFWRGVENLEMQSNTVWAVSQATDMRRVQVDGALYLHDDYGWASGGFLADSRITSMVDSGSQQQWLSRNNGYRMWMGENWNMVFLGDEEGGVPTGTWPGKSYTPVNETELIREKPFLFFDEKQGYQVFVPAWKTDAKGTDWESGEQPGEAISLKDFYIAKEGIDSAATLNEALKQGKHLLFTPGIYRLDEELVITRPGTIVLGMGLATLTPTQGNACLCSEGADGLILAGFLMDAGTTESETLLHLGSTTGEDAEPSLLADLYFRVGGTPTDMPAKVQSCAVIDADRVVGDNLWVWRADHGDQVAWNKNTARNGILLNGDHIRMYALMVEHFQEYQTVWNGEDGKCIMYQSEIPYDVPSPENWRSLGGTRDGFASFKVGEEVTSFEATGIGIYLYNRDAIIPLHCAMEIPDRAGVKVHNLITVMLTGHPGMEHGINDSGMSVLQGGQTARIIDYENGWIK